MIYLPGSVHSHLLPFQMLSNGLESLVAVQSLSVRSGDPKRRERVVRGHGDQLGCDVAKGEEGGPLKLKSDEV